MKSWLISKENAKHEEKRPCVPPLIPPQAGGQEQGERSPLINRAASVCGCCCTHSLHESLFLEFTIILRAGQDAPPTMEGAIYHHLPAKIGQKMKNYIALANG